MNDRHRICVNDGCYAFSSFLNHSCCPNVMRIVVDICMVVIVETKANKQIISYFIGDSYYFKIKNFVRMNFKKIILIECQVYWKLKTWKYYSDMLNAIFHNKNYPPKEIVLLQLCDVKCFLTASRSKLLFL